MRLDATPMRTSRTGSFWSAKNVRSALTSESASRTSPSSDDARLERRARELEQLVPAVHLLHDGGREL